jgi:hypothetical protein
MMPHKINDFLGNEDLCMACCFPNEMAAQKTSEVITLMDTL